MSPKNKLITIFPSLILIIIVYNIQLSVVIAKPWKEFLLSSFSNMKEAVPIQAINYAVNSVSRVSSQLNIVGNPDRYQSIIISYRELKNFSDFSDGNSGITELYGFSNTKNEKKLFSEQYQLRNKVLRRFNTKMWGPVTGTTQDLEKLRMNWQRRKLQKFPLKATYLKTLHMDILEIPNYFSVQAVIEALLAEDDVTGGWIDDVLQGAANPDLGGHESFTLNKSNAMFSSDKIRTLSKNPTDPFDPLYHKQWPHVDSDGYGIRTPESWQEWTGLEASEPLVIALIDSGIDYNHDDLRDRIWKNAEEICNNGIDDDNNGYIDDCYGWDFLTDSNKPIDENGHGTASAGIISAIPNNAIGVTGVFWNAKIMNLKALNKNIKGTVSGFVKAIDYALHKKVKISNNSYGGLGRRYGALEEAVNRARKKGMMFVAAAGNYGNDNDSHITKKTFPASYGLDNIISIAALTREGKLAAFSSYGKNTVHLAAPGDGIMTTFLNNKFKEVDGTSFAVPFVTSAVGLLWSREPYLSYKEIRRKIIDNTRHVKFLDDKIFSGGSLDIYGSYLDRKKEAFKFDCESDADCYKTAECKIQNNFKKECICKNGYIMQNGSCVNIDECEATKPCGKFAICVDTNGSYECICQQGYHMIKGSCRDIDECEMTKLNYKRSGICPEFATCVNLNGSFDCRCPTGYLWNANENKKFAYEELNSNIKAPFSQCLSLNTPSSGLCKNNGECKLNSVCQASIFFMLRSIKCQCVPGYVNSKIDETHEICIRDGIHGDAIYYLQSLYSTPGAMDTDFSNLKIDDSNKQCIFGICFGGQTLQAEKKTDS